MKASRDHRAFGGFSMGSVCTWYTFINCLDYIKYYIPLSGDCWVMGNLGGSSRPRETAEYLANVVRRSGYKAPHDFKIFCATGNQDIAYSNMNPQIQAMKNISDVFMYSDDPINGNFYFMVCNGGTHEWRYINQYIYNILPDLFKDTQNNNPQPSIKKGDVDGDGQITAIDLAYYKKYILGQISDFIVENDLEVADLDGNGAIDSLDLAYLKAYLLGRISKFPAS